MNLSTILKNIFKIQGYSTCISQREFVPSKLADVEKFNFHLFSSFSEIQLVLNTIFYIPYITSFNFPNCKIKQVFSNLPSLIATIL